MNNLKHIFFASMLMASMTAAAQETYQDAKLAAPQLTGTARYVGMGGAMEALGADISTISSNPAGIGLFRKSQVTLTAGVIAQTDAENYTEFDGSRIIFNGKKSHPTFDQVGIVWSPKNKGANWLNLAFNYHKSADFGQILNVKAGVIFRPVKDSPFRIGAYFNSPIFYDLTVSGDNDITISGNYDPAIYEEKDGSQQPCYVKGDRGQSIDYDFRLNTPWKVGASLGHTIGNYLALGATYEYAWYDHMDNRVKDGGYYDSYWGDYYESSSSDEAMNHDTQLNLQGVSTLKLGAEIKPVDMLSIRLGYNYVSPMYKDNALRDQTFDSNGVYIASSADYTNWKATNRFTLGVGFNYQNLAIDVAYQYSSQKGDFYPFESFTDMGCSVNATKVDNKRHQLLMTVGYRF